MVDKGMKRRKKSGSSHKLINKKKLRSLGPSNSEDGARIKKRDKKTKKFLQKKARIYNSDDDEEVEDEDQNSKGGEKPIIEVSEDELDCEIQPEAVKFLEGCKDFRSAFEEITKKKTADQEAEDRELSLSALKRLVAEKVGMAKADEAKKKVEKQMVGKKGNNRVKPANYLDSDDKDLVEIATNGVVKLFNSVNKAQLATEKEVFFSDLGSDQTPTPQQKTESKEIKRSQIPNTQQTGSTEKNIASVSATTGSGSGSGSGSDDALHGRKTISKLIPTKLLPFALQKI